MNLSVRALKYLHTLKRDFDWVSNEYEIKMYLQYQNIELNNEFLKYQLLFSGYELKINHHPNDSFKALLFSKKQIKNNEKLEFEIFEDRQLIFCGDHKSAPFNFLLTNKGEICTFEDRQLNIIYSSFEKLIEEYALKNEIFDWLSNPYYFEIKDEKNLIKLMNENYKIIESCSDKYSTWWQKEDIIAVKGIWLDKNESYFHVYGKKRKSCEDLIKKLTKELILSNYNQKWYKKIINIFRGQ